MSTEPTDPDAGLDPDADPEMLAGASGGAPEVVHGSDGVRESAPVADDPDDQDEPDADPGELAKA
jgi:hypothetical protein